MKKKISIAGGDTYGLEPDLRSNRRIAPRSTTLPCAAQANGTLMYCVGSFEVRDGARKTTSMS